MNLARKPASLPAHVLFSVARDTGSMLAHTLDGSIICTAPSWAGGRCLHHLLPDASLSPAHEAIVASRVAALMAAIKAGKMAI
jgi:hypothetical protein